MTPDPLLPLAMPCGDPAGVGPEVIAKAIASDRRQDYVIIGPRQWGEPVANSLGIGFVPVGPDSYTATPGKPTKQGAEIALAALQEAASGCVDKQYRGVVSGPVSKHWLQQVGFRHPGQTEFFGEAWGGQPTMAFVGESLCVVLATWHIPLAQVPQALTASVLEQAVRRADALARRLGADSPRIGVCGLNPHAGEGGILGVEERDILDPELDRLRTELPGLSKCLPGDTVFFRQRQGDFDVVVAAYHDQGLAAVKTLEFSSAVNVTLGLDFVRTSPDHGTAFELAGKGIADAGSFAAALAVAQQLTANRD